MAPPTLLDLTSTVGRILLIASLNILIGSSLDLVLILFKASYTIFSAIVFFHQT